MKLVPLWSISAFSRSMDSSLDLFPEAGRLFSTFTACCEATSSNLDVSSLIDSCSVASLDGFLDISASVGILGIGTSSVF